MAQIEPDDHQQTVLSVIICKQLSSIITNRLMIIKQRLEWCPKDTRMKESIKTSRCLLGSSPYRLKRLCPSGNGRLVMIIVNCCVDVAFLDKETNCLLDLLL